MGAKPSPRQRSPAAPQRSAGGQGNQNQARRHDDDTGNRHGPVAEAVGQKSIEEPPKRNTKVKERNKLRGTVLRNAARENQIAACPQADGGFGGAVTEKGEQRAGNAGDTQCVPDSSLPRMGIRFLVRSIRLFPKRQTEKQDRDQNKLDYDTVRYPACQPSPEVRQLLMIKGLRETPTPQKQCSQLI